jgi:hypothetical protein
MDSWDSAGSVPAALKRDSPKLTSTVRDVVWPLRPASVMSGRLVFAGDLAAPDRKSWSDDGQL